jgi:hypothetical protein
VSSRSACVCSNCLLKLLLRDRAFTRLGQPIQQLMVSGERERQQRVEALCDQRYGEVLSP